MPVTFLTDEDEKEYVRSVNGKKPDANGNVAVESGSGGGATPDWNAAEGEPGHILNRPFYKTVSTGMILENSQLVYSEDAEMLFVTDEFHLQVGNEYVVTWNGMDYTCTAFEFRESPEAPAMPAVGNKAAIGEAPTEEPFFLAGLPDGIEAEEGLWGMAMDLTGATEVTVSIQGSGFVYTKIPEEYLPDRAFTTKYIVDFDYSSTDKTKARQDYDSVEKIVKSGMDVVARLHGFGSTGSCIELQLNYHSVSGMCFHGSDDGGKLYNILWYSGYDWAYLSREIVKTPVKGVDYFTEEDKAELVQEVVDQVGTVDIDAIVQQVLDQLGTGVIGEVDADNNILITSTLPNGTYTMRYENADGSTTVIGTFTVSGGSDPVPDPEPDPEPTIVNLADPTSADWLINKRINSQGTLKDVSDAERGSQTVVMTNYMSMNGVSKYHVKGLDIMSNLIASSNNYGRYYMYDSGKTLKINQYQPSDSTLAAYISTANYDPSVVIIDVAGLKTRAGYADLTYMRLGGILTGTAEDVIITADQNIV